MMRGVTDIDATPTSETCQSGSFHLHRHVQRHRCLLRIRTLSHYSAVVAVSSLLTDPVPDVLFDVAHALAADLRESLSRPTTRESDFPDWTTGLSSNTFDINSSPT